jgi:hypothetical protein
VDLRLDVFNLLVELLDANVRGRECFDLAMDLLQLSMEGLDLVMVAVFLSSDNLGK